MPTTEALLGIIRASDYGARGGGNRDDSGGLAMALVVAATPGGVTIGGEGAGLAGGVVQLDPGVLYRLGRPVQIPSNVELVIPAGTIVRAAPSLIGDMFQLVGVTGARITGGGVIDGNRGGGAQANPIAISGGSSDCNLDGPIVQGGYTDGVSITGSTRIQLELTSQSNGRHGVYHSGSTFCSGQVIARDNGARVAGSGLAFDAASTDNAYQLVATDTRVGGAKTQQYGFFEVAASGSDRNTLSASSLTGNAAGTQSVVGASSGYVSGAPAAGTVNDASIAAGGLSNAALGTSAQRANQLVNGGFEWWQRGAGPFTANGAATADRWFFVTAGTDTFSLSKDTTHQDVGSAACAAITFTLGTGAGASYLTSGRMMGSDGFQFAGRTISASMRVRTATAAAVRIGLVSDGTGGTTTYSGFQAGSGAYQTLTVTATIPTDATQVQLEVFFAASCTAYLDNAALVVGSVAADYVPLPPADDQTRCIRYYETTHLELQGYCAAGGAFGVAIGFAAKKAVNPTLTVSGTWTVTNSANTAPQLASRAGREKDGYTAYVTATATAQTTMVPGAGAVISAEANP